MQKSSFEIATSHSLWARFRSFDYRDTPEEQNSILIRIPRLVQRPRYVRVPLIVVANRAGRVIFAAASRFYPSTSIDMNFLTRERRYRERDCASAVYGNDLICLPPASRALFELETQLDCAVLSQIETPLAARSHSSVVKKVGVG